MDLWKSDLCMILILFLVGLKKIHKKYVIFVIRFKMRTTLKCTGI